MEERIILAPRMNANEMIKNLALHGIDCVNTRICDGEALARIALMRSGVVIEQEFINRSDEIAVVAEAVKNIDYFRQSSYKDLTNISAAINRMRTLVTGSNEIKVIEETMSRGLFKEKNDALVMACKNYISIMNSKGCIDCISLIRKAIMESLAIDADFMVIKEYPLSPLETELIEKLSGKSFKTITIDELYHVDGKQKPVSVFECKSCYGAPNEVETIIESIYTSKRLDQCTVAVTDVKTYGQLFLDYSLQYEIPMTLGCGVPIINSNPAKLLSLYSRWITSGMFGAEALKDMVFSDSFNRGALISSLWGKNDDYSLAHFMQYLCDIRFTNDKQTNLKKCEVYENAVEREGEYYTEGESKEYKEYTFKKSCVPYLKVMAEEFALPVEEFINKYSYIRKDVDENDRVQSLLASIDEAGLYSICNELNSIRESQITQSDEDLFNGILGMTIMNQKSEPGAVHITSVDKAMCTIRDNLYIAGLSATKYPGSPKEDYLMLDDDLLLFGEAGKQYTSEQHISDKRERLIRLVELASSLDSMVHISYAGLNVSDLKKDNMSSLIYELFSRMKGDSVTYKELENNITEVEYFAPAISSSRLIGEKYINDESLKIEEKESASSIKAVSLEKAYSPSALNLYFSCPKRFMLKYIMGIAEPEKEEVFKAIAANKRGTIAHLVFEFLDKSKVSKEEFVDLGEKYFDIYFDEHPVLVSDQIKNVKKDFLDMIADAYDSDPGNEIVLQEQDIKCKHNESGVSIHGYPDRVEKLSDGSLLIADYKSGGKIEHEENDIKTCLQFVIYAYLIESNNEYKVSRGEFRYTSLGNTIKCKYDDSIKKQLTEQLKNFRDAMKNGEFPCAEDEASCKYCKYGSICGK